MTTVSRPSEQENGPARNHFATVLNKLLKYLFQIQDLGFAVNQGNNVDTEDTLQLGLGIEIIQNDLTGLTTPQLDHNTSIGGRLVAQLRNALDLLVLDQLSDLFNQTGAIHLVGNLFDDDGVFVGPLVAVDFTPGPDLNAAAARSIGLNNTAAAIDDARCRKIRPGDIRHQFIKGDIGVIDQGQAAVDDFGQVVGGNIGRHANRDTA